MKLLFFLLFTLVAGAESPIPTAAPVTPETLAPSLLDIFPHSDAPATGSLTYKMEDEKTERIEFNQTTGHYGLAIVFNGKSLPEPFKKDMANSEILQIALGTRKSAEDERLPQFAAATLLSPKIPTERTLFRLTVPNSAEIKKGPVAVLLFNSPSTKQASSDEEKLKETLFADSGSVILTPVGLKTSVTIKSKGTKYNFNRRVMKLDWNANLGTPFATAKRTLVGTIEIPFFWPKDSEAGKLASQIVTESLLSVGAGSKGQAGKKPRP